MTSPWLTAVHLLSICGCTTLLFACLVNGEENWLDDLLADYRGSDPSPESWCSYKGELYPPGPVQLKDCVSCMCNADNGTMECGLSKCPEIPDCIKFDNTTGKCCPDCAERGCFMENKTYARGTRIPTDPCRVCYCPWTSRGHGKPICQKIECPSVSCVDAVIPEGKCCPVCPRGKFTAL